MSETSLNIDMTDLGAVKIVCAHCQASIELPVARMHSEAPERCFHCRGEWFIPNSPQATALQYLFGALVQLRSRDPASGCHVQFVMKTDRGSSKSRMPK